MEKKKTFEDLAINTEYVVAVAQSYQDNQGRSVSTLYLHDNTEVRVKKSLSDVCKILCGAKL